MMRRTNKFSISTFYVVLFVIQVFSENERLNPTITLKRKKRQTFPISHTDTHGNEPHSHVNSHDEPNSHTHSHDTHAPSGNRARVPHTRMSHGPRPRCTKLDCSNENDCFLDQRCMYDHDCRTYVCTNRASRVLNVNTRRRTLTYCIMNSCESVSECGAGQICQLDRECGSHICTTSSSHHTGVHHPPTHTHGIQPSPHLHTTLSPLPTTRLPHIHRTIPRLQTTQLPHIHRTIPQLQTTQLPLPSHCRERACATNSQCPLRRNCEFDLQCRSTICKFQRLPGCSQSPCLSNSECGAGIECSHEPRCGYRVCGTSPSTVTCIHPVCSPNSIVCATGQRCVYDVACLSHVCKFESQTSGSSSCLKPPCNTVLDCGSGQICQNDIECGYNVCISTAVVNQGFPRCRDDAGILPVSCDGRTKCSSNNDCNIGQTCCSDAVHHCGNVCQGPAFQLPPLNGQNQVPNFGQNIPINQPTGGSLLNLGRIPTGLQNQAIRLTRLQPEVLTNNGGLCVNAPLVTASHCSVTSCSGDRQCDQNYECCRITACGGQYKCVRRN